MYRKCIMILTVVLTIGLFLGGCAFQSEDDLIVGSVTDTLITNDTSVPIISTDVLFDYTLDNAENMVINRSTGDGGAGKLVGDNYISFTIDTKSNSESEADYIDIYFGASIKLRLYSWTGNYPKGSVHYYNCYNQQAWFESWDQDLWDDVRFSTDQTDGFYFSNIKIVHSSQVILDYTPTQALDYPSLNPLYFSSAILSKKYSYLNTTHSIVRKGLRDMGKTDDDKYVGDAVWCSEFARYCISALFSDLPTGNVYTGSMKNYYISKSRNHNISEVYNKTYTMGAGDYMSINSGGHSVIFAEWVGTPTTFTSATQFRTIEGNSASTVRVVTRSLSQVDTTNGIGQN